ncbi:hypothetical protein [Belliella buryatensis]|uniref:hypothetical protein n=1 Tax=Belliella buryatensis TaxID=1500549 RepID=UPI000B78C9E8|nr:hypothetical protein [Belliella buryatensis]
MILKDRGIIYAQDIMIITGRSKSYAYKVLKEIKSFYNKQDHQMVTIEEYADFHGIPVQKVKDYVIPRRSTWE